MRERVKRIKKERKSVVRMRDLKQKLCKWVNTLIRARYFLDAGRRSSSTKNRTR
uniref:Uncharacterized protein n=1 Tax=Helianthus annuus TaxID=4232 RepID=A0A251TW74_HELAN